jgi:hypothetical protein
MSDGDRGPVDPENLPSSYTPAYVQVRGQGLVFVADYQTLDSGWIRVTEWSRDRAKLPPHRVMAVREVRTEFYGNSHSKRLADEKRRQQARADEDGGKAVVADD